MPPGARWRQIWLHQKHLRRLTEIADELGITYGSCLGRLIESARVTGEEMEATVGRTADQVNITVTKDTRDWLRGLAEREGVALVALLDSWREGKWWGVEEAGTARAGDDGL